MKVSICIIAMLYGLLSVIAPLAQFKDKEKRIASLIMMCGGVFLIAAGILKLMSVPIATALSAAGAALICISAVMNGLKNGAVHITHHVVRLIISCALVLGFFLT